MTGQAKAYHKTIAVFAATILIIASPQIFAQPTGCPAGMDHYWKLDETAGGPYADYYGTNDATCTNCPTSVTGILNGAQQFDGVDDRINIADDDSFDWGATTPFSIEFWMKSDGCDCTSSGFECNEIIVGRAGASNAWWIGVNCQTGGGDDGKLRAFFGTNGDLYSSSVIADGVWHHVAYVYDDVAGEYRLYIDGTLDNSKSGAGVARSGAGVNLQVGYFNSSPFYQYHGMLDELALYSSVLSLTDIQDHYNSGAGQDYCYSNQAPVALDQSISTSEDNSIGGQLAGTDADGTIEEYRIATGFDPANGTVDLTATTGAFTFTPDTDYNGSDEFRFEVRDNEGVWSLNQGIVSIDVTSVNDPPVASDQSFATDEDTPAGGQLAGTDVDGTIAEYRIATGFDPANGTVGLTTGTGAFTYTPDTDYNGTDEFRFEVRDNDGAWSLNQGIVSIDVTSVNDPPVASDQSFATDEDTPAGGQLAGTDVDGTIAEYRIATGFDPANGTVDLTTGTGVFTYTPDADYNGSDEFRFEVRDNEGVWSLNQGIVSIDVTSVNDPPVASDQSFAADEDTPAGGQLAGTDVDGTITEYRIATGFDPANGAVDLTAGTGAFTYTPDSEYSGADEFQFEVKDNDGVWSLNQGVVSITVASVNDAPVVGDIPDQIITEGESFTAINLDDYVSDVDNPDADMIWTYSGNVNLGVYIDENRVALVSAIDPQWNGSETITFTATDPGSLSDFDVAQFTILPVNQPPSVSDIPDQVIVAGGTFATITLDDYVADPDNADTEISWSSSSTVDLTVSIVNRVATINVPSSSWTGSETVTFTATDPGALFDSDDATFSVVGTACPLGMSHYWMLDETLPGTYADSYGSADATCTDCPTAGAGIINGAQQFDGIDDHVNVPDDDSFDWDASSSFSVEFWARAQGCGCTEASYNCNQVMVGRTPTAGGGWWIGLNCGTDAGAVNTLRCYFGGSVDLLSTTTFDDDQWHHVAFIFDVSAGEYSLFVDGVVEASVAGVGKDNSGSVPLTVGYFSSGFEYEGWLDELALYDIALPPAKVAEHYYHGSFGIGYCTDGTSLPQITSSPVTSAEIGQPYVYDVDANGFPVPTYSLLTSPAGMTIDAITGVIDWAPLATGDFAVEVAATNSEGSDTQPFTISVIPASLCTPDIVHYWDFNEVITGTYVDQTGGADATCTDCPTPITGKVGGAQEFDRVDDQLLAPDNDTYDWDATDSYSIEFWMKADCGCTGDDFLCNEVILSRFDIPNAWWIGVSCRNDENPGKLRCYFGSSADLYSTVDVNDEVWHYVAYVRDNDLGECRLYVDGALNSSVAAAGLVRSGTNRPIQIGWANGGPFYRYGGVLDELAIYDGVLDDSRIAEHYNGGSGAPYCALCGDADGSGSVSISDAVFIINYIFGGGPAPNPLAAGDADCSGQVSIADAVYIINFIFGGGPAPCATCS